MIRLAVITNPRPVGCVSIDRTISDMFRKDKSVAECEVKVFSDSLEPPELGRAIQTECRRPDELLMIGELNRSGCCVCSTNYVRALEWASDCDEASFVFEDDCFFAQDWLKKTMDCAAAVSQDSRCSSPNCWMLCLSHLYGHADTNQQFEKTKITVGDRRILFPSKFYRGNGSQAMAFSPRVAVDTAEDIRTGMAGPYFKMWGHPDVAVYLSAVARGHAFFAIDGCLIDHMNLHSTWQVGRSVDNGRTRRFMP